MALDVSVIIVNYNCDAYIRNAIRSVYEQSSDVAFEIIVSDNDSSDLSITNIQKEFPEVIIKKNGKNLGFGAANNRAAEIAKGKYLLFLNPDTVLLNNALKLFHDYAGRAGAIFGCCGGNLLDENRKPANLGGNFPSLFQLFSDIGFRYLYPTYYKKKVSLILTADTLPENRNIDYICGADMFISKDTFFKMNGFDEDYFLYYEDTDLCFRLKKNGYENHVLPEIKIQHLESAVIAGNRNEKMDFKKFSFFERGKQLFFRKSYGRLTLLMVKFLTIFYVISRWIFNRGNPARYFKMIVVSLSMDTR